MNGTQKIFILFLTHVNFLIHTNKHFMDPPTRKFYELTPFFPHKPIEIPTNEKIEPYPFLKYKLRI